MLLYYYYQQFPGRTTRLREAKGIAEGRRVNSGGAETEPKGHTLKHYTVIKIFTCPFFVTFRLNFHLSIATTLYNVLPL